MYLPKEVEWILQRLNRAGFSAFVVGGCVRDSLRGVTPHDWDLCTQALPEEIEQVFAGHPLKRTGARQGTITLILQHHPYEITTYRAEGSYSDHRRPDRVHYIDQVEPDLARRDFTINAMAYHPDVGLVDPFGGRQDLEQSVLRCVGEAEQRLQEDPLRILRAARFCATLGFTVAPETEAAMRQKRQQLCHVAPERQWSEIKQLFLQPYLGRVLRHFPDILFVVWPELAPMHGMDQCHPFHRWDVYEHSIISTENADNDLILRLTAFFHDSGKPKCFTIDDQGIGHMKGHPQVSEQLAEIALRRLRVEKAVLLPVCRLVRNHEIPIGPDDPTLRRQLSRLGEDQFRRLLKMKRCDVIAQGTHVERLEFLQQMEQRMETILRQSPCLSTSDLALNGYDLLTMGLHGPSIGRAQQALMHHVWQFPDENQPQRLQQWIKEHRDDF